MTLFIDNNDKMHIYDLSNSNQIKAISTEFTKGSSG